jgi:hypothetical protein
VLIGRTLAIGVIVAIMGAVLWVGATVIPFIAAQGTGPSPSTLPSPSPGIPRLALPAQPVTVNSTISVQGSLPKDLLGRSGVSIRIDVQHADGSTDAGGEVQVTDSPTFQVDGIPLQEGENHIDAVVVENGADGAHSDPIIVTRDTTAPNVTIDSPSAGAVVSGASATVTGKTDPEISVQIKNSTTGTVANGVSTKKGTFGISVRLQNGTNLLTVLVTDAAGNSAQAQVQVSTSVDVGRVTIDLNPGTIYLNKSRNFRVSALAIGTDGLPVVNVCVRITVTIRNWTPTPNNCILSDINGRAADNFTLPDSFTDVGDGLVLVQYTMPTGDPLSATTVITVQKKQ